jgi:hypothetical protein
MKNRIKENCERVKMAFGEEDENKCRYCKYKFYWREWGEK